MNRHEDFAVGEFKATESQAVSMHFFVPCIPRVAPKGATAQACTCGIQAGGSQHSHSYAASTRSMDPGTSFFPLSFLSHHLIHG